MATRFLNINFDEINLRTNWATLTAIVGLLVFSVTLYVNNTNKDHKIDSLETEMTILKNQVTKQDSTLAQMDEYVTELIQKSSAFEETDLLVFYKDVYFENRFRRIDGKTYFEFLPDKTDFYKKTSPRSSASSNSALNLPPATMPITSAPINAIRTDTLGN